MILHGDDIYNCYDGDRDNHDDDNDRDKHDADDASVDVIAQEMVNRRTVAAYISQDYTNLLHEVTDDDDIKLSFTRDGAWST